MDIVAPLSVSVIQDGEGWGSLSMEHTIMVKCWGGGGGGGGLKPPFSLVEPSSQTETLLV